VTRPALATSPRRSSATPEVINHVAFICQIAENVIAEGPLFEVAVIHHTQCGSGALADENIRRSYAQRIGADEANLRDHAVVDPAATVTTDVECLRSAPAISQRLASSGHVYDVLTGLVQTILPARCHEDQIQPPQGDQIP
jgi:carbonic anhydrase